jgi:hypothetical protein
MCVAEGGRIISCRAWDAICRPLVSFPQARPEFELDASQTQNKREQILLWLHAAACSTERKAFA